MNSAKQINQVLFRCDASREIGLGHVVRCIALADELHDVHGCRITFAMRTGPLGIEMVKQKGYRVFTPPEDGLPFDYGQWLGECVRNAKAKVLVLDVRDGLQRAAVDGLKDEGVLIVTLDDPEDKRLSADLAFCLPVPQVKRMDWSGFRGEIFVGWEWGVLRKEFSRASFLTPRISGSSSHVPRVLVIMGGSDPQGMTLKAVKALETLDDDFETVVVLGAGFQHRKEIGRFFSNCKRRFDVREDVKNMAELMAQSDFAVVSFGITAYETAAMGIPAVYLCLTEDHAESASAFVEEGMGVSVGVSDHVCTETLADKVRYLLRNTPKWSRMSAAQKIKSGGTKRIARLITERLQAVQNQMKEVF